MKSVNNAIFQPKKNLFPPLLIFAMLMILSIIYFYYLAVAQAAAGNYPLDFNPEVNNTSQISCNCVAFRFDDVQDDYLTIPQIRVMDLFTDRNLSLTVGIIGNNTGNGEKTVSSYIKERMVNTSNKGIKDTIEIANHSWYHEHFLNLTHDQQFDSIRETNKRIENIFGVTPTIFIPPYGEFNNDTLSAVGENNMRIISADTRDHQIYSSDSNAAIYHFPETATTGYCKNCKNDYSNASWYGVSHEKTLSEINSSLSKYGFAVVLMHPDEYSIGHEEWNFQNLIDVKQISELELLIDEIQDKGLSIVTIGDIRKYFQYLDYG